MEYVFKGDPMGFIRRFRSQEVAEQQVTSTRQRQTTQPRAAQMPRGGFAVVDVETTGLSPRGDRILELAILRSDCRAWIQDEWVSRFNPEGPVGATHIHGITQADVEDAPIFADALPELNARLSGSARARNDLLCCYGALK